MKDRKLKRIAVIAERTNGYARNVIEGIADFAATHENWTLELLDPTRLADSAFDEFDGFITRLPHARQAERLRRLRRPVVETGGVLDRCDSFVQVRSDIQAVSRLAAEHFLALHHAHFAYCGFDGQRYSHERARTFVEALGRQRQPDVAVYEAPAAARRRFAEASQYFSPLDVPDKRSLLAWLKKLPKPTALFCCNDRRAYQVLQLCREARIRVPQDLSICGVDNDPILCTFLSPRLTSVDPDAHRVGHEAATVLAGLLGEPGFVRHRAGETISTPPKGVVMRTSTAVFPLDPPWLADALLFIRQHTCDHLTAADVCAAVGKSNGSLNGALQAKLGTTIQKEIATARLEVAKTLLICENLQIRDVAVRAGFASTEYFCRCFTQAVGIPPTAFRSAGNTPSAPGETRNRPGRG